MLLICLLTVMMVGCDSSARQAPVGPQDALWGKYIGAHTSGLVSRKTKIRVLFVSDVVGKDSIGKAAEGVIDVEPGTSGTSTFASEREVVFAPSNDLLPGTAYRVTVHGGKLLTLPSTIDRYQFAFQVIKPDFDMKIAGLEPAGTGKREMKLTGTIETADTEEPQSVERMVSAQVGGKALKLDWIHGEDGKRHDFTIQHIPRREKPGTIRLAWDGHSIGVGKSDRREIEIPALAAFKALKVEPVAGSPPHIAVRFSDELDPRQNLAGLIRTDQPQSKVRIEGSSILIYPDRIFTAKVTVTVDTAIRDSRGERLGAGIEQVVAFAAEKPRVRFAGKGVILPDSPVLSIPFEAINVQSVQVAAFQIYDRNVGQFLQTNKLDGTQELERVGRFLWRKTVQLPSVGADTWTRYSLDATQLLRDHPGSLFRLTLSINRGNSTYPCEKSDAAVPVMKEPALTNSEDLNVKEASSWDYAESYAHGNSDDRSGWSERDNPCKDAYFQHADSVRDARNFLASGIGPIAKRDQAGRISVAATDLQTAMPMEGVRLQLINFQNQVVGEAVIDDEGFARIEAKGAQL